MTRSDVLDSMFAGDPETLEREEIIRALDVDVKMNKGEERYAEHLEERRKAGEILAWVWEPFKLKLAYRAWYTPDFVVITLDRVLEVHEFKGFWRSRDRVRIKVAATLFPWFRFFSVEWKKPKGEDGRYEYELIPPVPR